MVPQLNTSDATKRHLYGVLDLISLPAIDLARKAPHQTTGRHEIVHLPAKRTGKKEKIKKKMTYAGFEPAIS